MSNGKNFAGVHLPTSQVGKATFPITAYGEWNHSATKLTWRNKAERNVLQSHRLDLVSVRYRTATGGAEEKLCFAGSALRND